MSTKNKPNGTSRVKIEGDWDKAVEKALKKKRPEGDDWPDDEPVTPENEED